MSLPGLLQKLPALGVVASSGGLIPQLVCYPVYGSYSFPVPAAGRYVCYLVGAGGGAGSGNGGSGTTARSIPKTLNAGQIIAVTVGTGGAGVANSNNSSIGSSGGASVVTMPDGSSASAPGGTGGSFNTPGASGGPAIGSALDAYVEGTLKNVQTGTNLIGGFLDTGVYGLDFTPGTKHPTGTGGLISSSTGNKSGTGGDGLVIIMGPF